MRESQIAESSEKPESSGAGVSARAGESDQRQDFVIDDYSSSGPRLRSRVKRLPLPRISTRYALALILLLAIALRLYGINWDQGGLFHPDERAFLSQVYNLQFPEGDEWSNVLDPELSTLNPGSFNWGVCLITR